MSITKLTRKTTVLGATALACIVATSVIAQDLANVGVRERLRPAYDPIGGRVGSFFLYPTVETGLEITDNLFASETHEESDIGVVFEPTLNVRSNFARHKLDFEIGAESRTYFDHSDENAIDYHGGVDGRYDVSRATNLVGSAKYGLNHERRGFAGTPTSNTAERVEWNKIEITGGVNHRFNRVSVLVGAGYATLDFDDVRIVSGGTLDQDFRDRDILQANLNVDYEFSNRLRPFVKLLVDDINYDNDAAGVLDSTGVDIIAGADFYVSTLVSGSAGVGLITRDYDNPAFDDVTDLGVDLKVEWLATPLITVNAHATRDIIEAGNSTAAGVVSTEVGAALDYELRRNIIVSPSIGFINDDYDSAAAIDRNDDIFIAALQLDYLINRNLSASASYNFRNRSSNYTGLDFTENIFGLFIKLQF